MTDYTVKQSGGDYSTLDAAIGGSSVVNISIEGTWTADDTQWADFDVSGITVTADSDSKHPGYIVDLGASTSAIHYRIVSGNGETIEVAASGTTIKDIVIVNTGGDSDEGIDYQQADVTVDACVIHSTNTTANKDGLYTSNTGRTLNITNTIITGWARGGIHLQNYSSSTGDHTANIDSCTIYKCGTDTSGGGIKIALADMDPITLNVDNTICVGNTGGSGAADYQHSGGSEAAVDWDINYCIDSDGSISSRLDTGGNNLASRTETDSDTPGTGDWVVFEDVTTAPWDLRLKTNAENDAENAGATTLTEDIVGTSRPQTTDDRGAFEISSSTEDTLLADDVESNSEVDSPSVGQKHVITAGDVESSSQVSSPAIDQVHGLLADDVESSSQVSIPTVAEVNVLFADDVESSSEVSSAAVGQLHAILADDVESSSEVSSPAVGQAHSILADDVESSSEVSSPALTEANVLLADDVESASEVSSPALTSSEASDSWFNGIWWRSPFWGTNWWGAASVADHSLLTDDVESASEVDSPAIGQVHVILADDVESASEVSNPAIAQAQALLADDVESASEVSAPSVTDIPVGTDALFADDVEAASEVSAPTIGQVHVVLSDDVESVSEVSSPSVNESTAITADDVESVSEVSVPTVTQLHAVLADDVEVASEVSSPSIGQLHVVLADDVEAASELSSPGLDSVYLVTNLYTATLASTARTVDITTTNRTMEAA